MSHPNDQHLSLKDKITSHLPGHKNQDNNANGVPDRLEKNAAATHNSQTGYTTGHVVPGATATTTTTSVTKDVNGLPIQGNILNDRTTTSTTVQREAALIQPVGGLNDLNRNGIPDNLERRTGAVGGLNDLNRNGIPDNLERQGSYGQTTTTTGFTDLNRNGIPDQLEGRQGFGFVGSVQANQTSVVDVREAPTVVERVEKAAVVHEVYKTEEVVQIQPVINREREQLDVYEVVQPIREREVVATEVREAMLPAQTRAVVVEDNSAFLAQRSVPGEFSTREVTATMSQTVTNAPIVHETITHRVIEEVQPVIYKEIDRPVLIKETQPIYERVVEAPHSHHTVLPMRDLGVRTTTTTTGFTDLNRDGIPDQLQGGAYHTTGLQSGLTTTGVYQSTTVGGLNDLNRNGIPDNLERQGSYGQTGVYQSTTVGGLNDLNRNGIPDNLERQGSYGQTGVVGGLNDLNRNGIPDNLERRTGAVGGLNDLNRNGIPDNLERHGQTGVVGGLNDLNRNGIPDNLERQGMVGQGYPQQHGGGLLSQPQIVQHGYGQTGLVGQPGLVGQGVQGHRTLNDLNGNGIPDRMEPAHGLKDLNGNGVNDSLERRMGATTLNQNTRL